MSKIQELFQNKNTVYFFDVDGVLAPIEYDDYNHYLLNDEEWAEAVKDYDYYEDKRPFKVFQDFIKERDIHNIYVVTRVMNESEAKQKKKFLNTNYGILEENIYDVLNNEDKLKVIKKIHQQYPNLQDKYFVMIEDSLEVLNYILEHSEYSTVHVSSFLK